jgi:hypothetical protein
LAYKKKTWKYGESIVAKDLNRMEDGILEGITQAFTEVEPSTTKNNDGTYNNNSGKLGALTPERAAYLNDFVAKFWPYERCDLFCSEEQYAGNCVHGGLYAPISTGRPTDVDDSDGVKEMIALVDIPDNLNNRAVQLGISLKRDGYVWVRRCVDKNKKTYADWVRIAPITSVPASTVNKSNVIIVTSDMEVHSGGSGYVNIATDISTTEIVIESGAEIRITLPKTYNGWRIIVNMLNIVGSDGVVLKDGNTDETISLNTLMLAGNTYAIVYNNGWNAYTIDNITRVIQTD